MAHQISVTIPFCAGHRILGHKGKCRYLHGHNYSAIMRLEAVQLNPLGMVADFSVVKDVIGKWIMDNWDHNMILSTNDPVLSLPQGLDIDEEDIWAGKAPYVLRNNPTAENIAVCLWNRIIELCPTIPGLTVVKLIEVIIKESENTYASYTGGGS